MTFLNIFDTITHNSIFPIATFIIGILVRTYFYYKSRKNKRLKYVIKSFNLIKDHTSKYSGLTVKYKDEDVKTFTVTKLIFWNSGKETIDGKDITGAEPLTINVKEAFRLLEVSIEKSNNAASSIIVSHVIDGKSATVSFDYLDNLDGAVLNIIHDGITSKDVEFIGKIKGVKQMSETSVPPAPKKIFLFVPFPISKDISKYNPNKRRTYYGLSWIWNLFMFVLLLGLFKLLAHYFPDNKDLFVPESDRSLWIMLIPFGLMLLNGIYIMTKKLPKELDLYEDA